MSIDAILTEGETNDGLYGGFFTNDTSAWKEALIYFKDNCTELITETAIPPRVSINTTQYICNYLAIGPSLAPPSIEFIIKHPSHAAISDKVITCFKGLCDEDLISSTNVTLYIIAISTVAVSLGIIGCYLKNKCFKTPNVTPEPTSTYSPL